jgi:hypothetical protein
MPIMTQLSNLQLKCDSQLEKDRRVLLGKKYVIASLYSSVSMDAFGLMMCILLFSMAGQMSYMEN